MMSRAVAALFRGVLAFGRRGAFARDDARRQAVPARSIAAGKAVARREREARAAGSLSSRHAVRVFDIDMTEDATPFIVMAIGLAIAWNNYIRRPELAAGFVKQFPGLHRFLMHEMRGRGLSSRENLAHHADVTYFSPASKKLASALK